MLTMSTIFLLFSLLIHLTIGQLSNVTPHRWRTIRQSRDDAVDNSQLNEQRKQQQAAWIRWEQQRRQQQIDQLLIQQMNAPFDTQAAVAQKQRIFERPVETNGYLRNVGPIDIGFLTNVEKGVKFDVPDPDRVQLALRVSFGESGLTGALPIGFPDQGERNPLNLNDYDGDKRRIVPNKAALVMADVWRRRQTTASGR